MFCVGESKDNCRHYLEKGAHCTQKDLEIVEILMPITFEVKLPSAYSFIVDGLAFFFVDVHTTLCVCVCVCSVNIDKKTQDHLQ
jgi:hypothetical protein